MDQINHNNENEIDFITNEYEISWNAIINEWIEATQKENQFDNNEDNHLLETQYEFLAAERDVYPADDEIAKWSLEYFFKENLKALTFLEVE